MADDLLGTADLIADAFDLSGAEINDILDAAPLVARLPWVPSSNGITHKYIRETSNPVTGWRAVNAGRELDSSIDTLQTITLYVLDYSFAVDKALADAWRTGGAEALIAREGRRHIRSALAVLEDQIINDTSASGVDGLAGLSTHNGLADAMVVNAGGTTPTTGSSAWLIRLGDMSGVAGVYRGDGPPFELGDTIVQDMYMSANSHMPAYYTPGCGWCGLQIGGTYSISRIANLTEDAGKGLTDDLIAKAISLHPMDQQPTVVVMNRRSRRQLQDSRTATNATGAPAPFPMESHGVEIIVTDAIGSTETLLA